MKKMEEQADENLRNLDILIGHLIRHGLLSTNKYIKCKKLLYELTLEIGEVFEWESGISPSIKKEGGA